MPAMQWVDLLARPRPKASERVAYGADPNQVADVWRPSGTGPHLLVIMIHGGCWRSRVANLDIMDWAADDLRGRGYLVWNIEYRRVDQPGGGFPGTYQDVAAAVRYALTGAAARGGDPARVVVLGHSAGGHLALWAAGQNRVPASSPLHPPEPFKPLGVVALGAITDLEADTATGCGPDDLPAMAGAKGRSDPYRDTSPYAMVPLGVRTVLITGADDITVPPDIMHRYAERARTAGDWVQALAPAGGHVEEIAPGTEAWAAVVAAVDRLAKAAP